MQPVVSIIIPTHRPVHFRNALNCAMGQTYANIEIIVSDNSGGGEIESLCRHHRQVVYRRNENGKPGSNIAQPLAMASGEYVKYLFDDDLIYPHCVASMIGWLEQFPQEHRRRVGMITSARHLINDDSLAYAEIREPDITNTSYVSGDQAAKKVLIFQDNFIGEFSTILFRRDLINAEDPESIFSVFGEDFSLGLIDVPLYLSIFQRADMLYIPHSLSAFRKHAEGGSNVAANPDFHYVVSDWFRLTKGAFRSGMLSADEARRSTENFLRMVDSFLPHFRAQLTPWKTLALEFYGQLPKSSDH